MPWIELREPHQPTSSGAIPTAPVSPAMRQLYSGKIVLNSDYDWTDARSADRRRASPTRISFGRPFIANPDLVSGSRLGAPLNEGDGATFYSGGARGLRRLSDARRSEGGLRRVLLAQRRTRRARPWPRRRPCRLRRVGADDRLRLVLDGQDAVADGDSPPGSAPSARARFRWRRSRNDRSRRGSTTPSATKAQIAAAARGQRDRAGKLERAGHGDRLMPVARRLDRARARRPAACR